EAAPAPVAPAATKAPAAPVAPATTEATPTPTPVAPAAPTAPKAPTKPGPTLVKPKVTVTPVKAESTTAGKATSGVTIRHIEYDPPGRDLEGEYVLITNTTATPIKLAGWTLSNNEAKQVYTFPAFTLKPGAEVKIWSKRGINSARSLYWNSRVAVWNHEGDAGTLKDANGTVISVFTYTGKKGKG
ncbi:MAG: lamin tail domain-containing protein, partial [Oscillochloris sp.]|nr:lamin tail domain-containing protein [Oscillochloris sp.]